MIGRTKTVFEELSNRMIGDANEPILSWNAPGARPVTLVAPLSLTPHSSMVRLLV
jgi:hypothetical protein